MNSRLIVISIVTFIAIFTSSNAKMSEEPAQEIIQGVTYICNGEQVVVTSCDIDDLSDSATCQVAYFDRPKRNGYTVVSSETRGTLRKLLPTCKQPTAEDLEKKRKFDEGVERRYQAEIDARNDRLRKEREAIAGGTGANAGGATDPGTLAMRRCVASGRPVGECFAEVMGSIIPGYVPSVAPKKTKPGLRLSGKYKLAGLSIEFPASSDRLPSGTVNFGCGKLAPEPYDYAITNNGGSIVLKLMTKPPVSFSLQPGGNWSGPGVVQLSGKVIVGYGPPRQETVTVYDTPVAMQRNIGVPINYDDTSTYYYDFPSHKETRTVATPIYKPATDRCTLGTLMLTGAASDRSTISQATGLVRVPPGLRMGGEYIGAGGFSINFHPTSATVNCGEAAWSDEYIVEPTGREIQVRLKNGASPFVMILRDDGTLVPSTMGAVTVAGREMVGMNGAQPVYRPKTARCQLQLLSPKP